MGIALKVFVCGFSFLFSAYFCAVMFGLIFTPFVGMVASGGHPQLAFAFSFIPLVPAVYAGIRAARAALHLERQR